MTSLKVIRNEDIERALIGVPKGHKHLGVYMKLKDATLLFKEATIARIKRVYLTIKTHPKIRAQELRTHELDETSRKQSYAFHQLLETPTNQEEIEKELRELLKKPT